MGCDRLLRIQEILLRVVEICHRSKEVFLPFFVTLGNFFRRLVRHTCILSRILSNLWGFGASSVLAFSRTRAWPRAMINLMTFITFHWSVKTVPKISSWSRMSFVSTKRWVSAVILKEISFGFSASEGARFNERTNFSKHFASLSLCDR